MRFAAPRITWAVQRLIVANAVVFAVQLLADPIQAFLLPQYWTGYPPGGLLTTSLGFQPDLFLSGHLWKPFTYQFLHAGLLHLFLNMLWLFFFGPDVERSLGTRQFFRFYIFCGALGVMATMLPFALRGDAPSVSGASGAVMGVMVAFAMIEPDRQFFLFPLPVPINARALVLIVVVMNIISALGESSVSVATHFGGMACGYAYMKLLPTFLGWQRERRRQARDRRTGGDRGRKGDPDYDEVGKMVDNIFRFEDHDDRDRR